MSSKARYCRCSNSKPRPAHQLRAIVPGAVVMNAIVSTDTRDCSQPSARIHSRLVVTFPVLTLFFCASDSPSK
ncbi:hypothetical protein LMH87_004851 [Akanthomyces muscarius]|uniref:Uncharacterized protein n=1 Tax=Akanthomyces muscarius TaxID=2231603 RepID=A0A9W8Q629_AKAMU|nr:hypothetical protein LMH87_004851 [Akanthomyces muscarius]KAJ4146021.1 hypothetical protein LMH87_004851 [Akanthomyces muscarius]